MYMAVLLLGLCKLFRGSKGYIQDHPRWQELFTLAKEVKTPRLCCEEIPGVRIKK